MRGRKISVKFALDKQKTRFNRMNIARLLNFYHSSYAGLRALKLIPIVPNSSALEGFGTSSNILCFCTISASIKPAAFTVLTSSASGSPPAIQPVHNEISSKDDFGIDFATNMSPM